MDSSELPASDEVFGAVFFRFLAGDFAVRFAIDLAGAGHFEGAGFFSFAFTGRALFFSLFCDPEDHPHRWVDERKTP